MRGGRVGSAGDMSWRGWDNSERERGGWRRGDREKRTDSTDGSESGRREAV